MPKASTSKKFQRLTRGNAIAAVVFVLIFGAFGVHYLFTGHAAAGLQASVGWKGNNSKLESKASGLCVTTPGTSKGGNGAHLQLATCDSRTGEKWTLTWGDGSGTIKNTTVVNGYKQCLDDTNSSTTPNTAVEIWACNGQASSQTWQTGYGDGTIRIHGMCLGTLGNNTGSGATLALVNCTTTPPTPFVSVSAPRSGARVSGTAVTVAASASTAAGSISSIRLTANGGTLKTCTNATSCSATWNVSKLKNGSYSVGATATASGGGSKATSVHVTVSNPSPPHPQPTPQPKPNPAPAHQTSSSGSGSGSTSSGGSTSAQRSPLTNLAPSGSSLGSSSSGSTSSGSNSTAPTTANNNLASKNSSSAAGPAIIITLLLLIVAAALIVFVRRRQAQKSPPAVVDLDLTNLPVYPREDPAQTAARLNWWQTDQQRQQGAQQPKQNPTDEIPDMYAEGRKRLEEEEKHNHPES